MASVETLSRPSSAMQASSELPPAYTEYFAPSGYPMTSATATADNADALPSYASAFAERPCNNRWGRYRSEEEYLAALRAWAREKESVSMQELAPAAGGRSKSVVLHGFYGNRTLQESLAHVEANSTRRVRKTSASSEGEREGSSQAARNLSTVDNPRCVRAPYGDERHMEAEYAQEESSNAAGRRRRGSVMGWLRRK